MPYGTVNVDSVVNSDGVTSGGLYGFKNRIINGAMVIDQRNAGASSSAYSDYVLDRWFMGASGISGKFTTQRNAGSVTPPAGFANYLGVTSSSAYSVGAAERFFIQQNIEGFNVADLNFGTVNAATVTLSFWVRSSLTGTFGGSLQNYANTRSYPFSYTISAANTWEQKTITIAGDQSGTWVGASNAGAMSLNFGFGVGSTYSGTAGSWSGSNYQSVTGATSVVGTNGATFYITGVQLEKGSTATSFDYRPYGTELALCQRYYANSFQAGTAPAQGAAAGFKGIVTAYDGSAGWISTISYPVKMRANATVTLYRADTGSTDGVWGVYSAGSWASLTSNTAYSTNDVGFYVSAGLSKTTNYSYLTTGNWAASAEL